MDCNPIFQDVTQNSLSIAGGGTGINYITTSVGIADKLIGIVPANRMIQRIHIDVIDPYDIPAYINIGDNLIFARLWRFGNRIDQDQIYTKLTDYKYNTPTQIWWRFETLPAFGSATITIHFS